MTCEQGEGPSVPKEFKESLGGDNGPAGKIEQVRFDEQESYDESRRH